MLIGYYGREYLWCFLVYSCKRYYGRKNKNKSAFFWKCFAYNYIMLFKIELIKLKSHLRLKKKSLYYSQAIIWIQIQMVLFLLVFPSIHHRIVRLVCFFNINWWYHNSVLHLHWRTKFSSRYPRPCFPYDCIFSHFPSCHPQPAPTVFTAVPLTTENLQLHHFLDLNSFLALHGLFLL